MSNGPPEKAAGVSRHPLPRVDGYELRRRIGEGSCGEVWLAQNIMEEWRAVKIVYQSRLENNHGFYEREFKGLRKYEPISRSHSSLVQILHMGRDEELGCFYYVMELADDAGAVQRSAASRSVKTNFGQTPLNLEPGTLNPATYVPRTLSSVLKEASRLPVDESVKIGVALATALEKLHECELVHRDIKPTNIIFVNGQPKLADVGLVTSLDATRSLVGTHGYMAPEGPGHEAADIYSFGKVLYEMSTGRDRADFPALPDMDAFPESERQALHELNAVILKACAGNPTERHRSATELREELVRLTLGESIVRQRSLERMARRTKVVALWGAAAVAVVGLGLGLWFYRTRSIEQSRNVAFKEAKARRGWGARHARWFAYNWTSYQQAAYYRVDAELLGEAANSLSGLDAERLCSYDQFGGVGAAFSPNGTALIGSDGVTPALMIAPDGTKSELPVRDVGPVSWTPEGVPVQLSANSTNCVLKSMRDGLVLSTLPLESGDIVAENVGPVLALSKDGRWAAAAVQGENSTKKWHFEPRNHGAPPPHKPEILLSPSLSSIPNGGEGARRAGEEADHGVRSRLVLWETATSRRIGEAPLLATALVFSDDGMRLVAGCEDGSIHIYGDLESDLGAPASLLASQPPAGMPAVPGEAPSSGHVTDRVAMLEDWVPSMKEKRVLPAPPRNLAVRCLAVTRDRLVPYDSRGRGKEWLIAAGYEGGEIGIWETRSGSARSWCRGSHWTVAALAFHPDGQTLASSGRNEVRLWDIVTSQLVLRVGVQSSAEGTALAIDAEGRRMVFGSRPDAAKTAVDLWEFTPHHGIQLLRGLTSGVRKIWFSNDGQLIAGLSDDWRVAIWDTRNGGLLWRLETPVGIFADNAGGAFDSANKRFAFCAGREACVYDLESGEVRQRWELPRGTRDEMSFDKMDRLLLARGEKDPGKSDSSSWRIYELKEDEPPRILRAQTEADRKVEELIFVAGGARLATRCTLSEGARDTLQCFDVESGRQLWESISQQIPAEAFIRADSSGEYLAYAPLKLQPRKLIRVSDFSEVGSAMQDRSAIGPGARLFAVPTLQGWGIATEDPPKVEFALGPEWGMGYTPTFSPKGNLFAWSGDNWVLLAHLDEVRQRLDSLKRRK